MSRRHKRECPNPLFLKWLEEWRIEASEKNSKQQYAYGKAIASLKKYPLPLKSGEEAMILDNIDYEPPDFYCVMVDLDANRIGGMIARRLDEALSKYNASDQEPVGCFNLVEDDDLEEVKPVTNSLHVPPPVNLEMDSSVGRKASPMKTIKKPRQKVAREYIPLFRTGPYALIMTLYRQSLLLNYRGYMTKSELQREAQPLCDTSFTVRDPGSNYTAWSSMSTLIKKGYIIKECNPARYSITDAGCALAQKLETVSQDSVLSPTGSTAPISIDSFQSSSCLTAAQSNQSLSEEAISTKTSSVALESQPCTRAERSGFPRVTEKEKMESSERPLEDDIKIVGNPEFVLRPGTFDIVLCVDITETTGGAAKSRKDALIPELKSNGVNFDVRKLQLGDFVWVARERTSPVPGCLVIPVARELVLDYIVERKRMDDLCGSIIDGRFREQKFRLRHCGLKHPIYLVEDFGSPQHMSLPESTLQQAIVNTQVVDGFFVKRTHDLKESVAYLTLMTRYLQRLYNQTTLVCCHQEGLEAAPSNSNTAYLMSFQEFNDSTIKNKVMTVSEVFAKQLMQISGVSADKAAAILENYPTPKKLLDAYESQSSEKDKELLLSALKAGKNQRNLGPSISRLIYQLFCSTSLS